MLPRAAAYRRLYCYPATVFALTVSASASSVTSDTQVTALAPHSSPRRTEYLGSRRAHYLAALPVSLFSHGLCAYRKRNSILSNLGHTGYGARSAPLAQTYRVPGESPCTLSFVAVIIVIIVIILGNAGWRKAAAQVAARGRLPGRVC